MSRYSGNRIFKSLIFSLGRVALVLASLGLIHPTHAQDSLPLEYTKVSKSGEKYFPTPDSARDVAWLGDLVRKTDPSWIELDDERLGAIPFLEVDQVFSNQTMTRTLLFRRNLSINRPELLGQWVPLGSQQNQSLWAFHWTLPSGSPGALVAVFEDSVEETSRGVAWRNKIARALLQDQNTQSWARPLTSKVLELLSQVIVPRSAFADPVCSPGDGLGSMPPQKLAAQTSRVLTNLLAGPRTFEQLKSCLVGGLRGAWASTGGTIESLIELIKQGGSSYLEMLSESYAPIDSPQALLGNAVKFSSNLTTGGVDPAVLWKKLLSRVDQIKSFIHQIGPVLSRAFPAFLELSDEAQMEILCNIKAQLSIDTLITILTAGAGSGAVLTKIAAYGGKLAKIADFLVMVGKLGKQFSKASQELMGSVLKGLFKWSEQHLSAINFYSKIGAEKLVVGLSKCD